MPVLSLAAIGGHMAVLQVLLEANADPNLTDFEGETALHSAVMQGRAEAVRQLLISRADASLVFNGKNALEWAHTKSQAEIARILVEVDDAPESQEGVGAQ